MRASPTSPLAIVTSVYNEPDFLPVWIKYYSTQIGASNCYVIDHGSDDGSTEGLVDINHVRIPRSLYDNSLRVLFVADFCKFLLRFFDMVAYVDVDEIVVADPENYTSLVHFSQTTKHDVVTTFGLNVVHRVHQEADLDVNAPILAQRPWALPVSAMAKPAFTRRPITWAQGFHSADADLTFDGLFNFHLARCDLALGLKRQAKRRSSPFAQERANHHHRHDDDQVRRMMDRWARMPTIPDTSLRLDCPAYVEFSSRLKEASIETPGRSIRQFPSNMDAGKLWRTPDRFLSAF